ncbi:MAG: WG repeat-containing protein [Flavobacterium sp.]|uniref:WG repeat-containing protein n=1 Tax=Flavobacterium sp. TaxID=239 RepID=UPI0026253097|nr:WG repeat-containing protein [Flavobacterium sp.]MDD5149312.1 WG repeat-containing protein [Flavobacterium sp.]
MKLKSLLLPLFLILSISVFAQKTFTCIDDFGKELFKIDAEFVYAFSNNRCAYKKQMGNEWKWGFIDEKGNTIIEPKYDKVLSFSDGVTWATIENQEMLLDTFGERIQTNEYSKVGQFIEGMCAVYQDDKMGFINTSGIEVLPCEFIGSPAFSEGLVCLSLANSTTENYGFYDKNGKLVIPHQFKQAGFSNFKNGECRVKLNGKICLIDTPGKPTFIPKLSTNMDNFENDLSRAYTKPNRIGFGYFNRENQWVIKPIYTNANSFLNGFSIAKMNDKYGVINTIGKNNYSI